jgi:hypothetical protein
MKWGGTTQACRTTRLALMGGLLKHFKFAAKTIQFQRFKIQNYESNQLVNHFLFTIWNVLKTLEEAKFFLFDDCLSSERQDSNFIRHSFGSVF